MQRKHRTIQHRSAINRGPCRVPFCGLERHGAHHYCQNHVRAMRRYGHPQGVRIYPRDYSAYRTRVHALLRDHLDHPGAQAAIAWLSRWIDRAGRGEPVAGTGQVCRLHAQGVPAISVLEELAGIATLSHMRPRVLPSDDRLTFALANGMLYLAPRSARFDRSGHRRYRPIPKAERAAIGQTIREAIGPLLAVLAATIAASYAKPAVAAMEIQLQKALTAPFGINLRIPMEGR